MAYPADLKYDKESHVWVKVDGNKAKLGITSYGAEQLGDILFVDLPEEDAEFSKGDKFTEVESSKATQEVNIPVSGKVVAANEELDDSPENINEDAYAAWICEIELSDASEADALASAADYEASLG